MNYFIRSTSDIESLMNYNIANIIIENNSQLLIAALSNLSEEKKRDVLNKVDSYGNTCLGLASNNETSERIIDILIKNGACVNQADFYGQTPLQYACLAENEEVIDSLLKAGADVNFIEERYAALHTAASKGNVKILLKLIQSDANVNILTRRGISPLHCAIESGYMECARLLLQHGATVNFPNHDLRKKPQSSSFADPLLVMATGLGNVEAVRMLLDFGAKPNFTNIYGMTALTVSCNRHFNEIAKLLLQYGADVNISDGTGCVPLHYAARHGDVDLVEMILAKGSDRNVLDVNGESPLNLAIRSQNINVIKLLIQYGCSANLSNSSIHEVHHPPIIRATCCFNDPAIFEEVLLMLLHIGCDINTYVPGTNETALYKALDLKKNHIAKVLLKHNARIDIECPHSLTILNKACQKNMRDVVEVMCKLGIDWTKEDWLVHGGNWTCITNRNLGRTFFEVPDPDMPTIFWNKLSLYHILRGHMRSPLSLQSLCRYSVRKCIRRNFKESIEQLRLPSSLKEFLMFADIDI